MPVQLRKAVSEGGMLFKVANDKTACIFFGFCDCIFKNSDQVFDLSAFPISHKVAECTVTDILCE